MGRWMPSAALVAALTVVMLQTPAAHAAPPDGRAYELVSPAEKSKGAVLYVTGGLTPPSVTAATPDGRRVAFISYASFGDNRSGQVSAYVAERGADGWRTRTLSPPPTDPSPGIQTRALPIDLTADFQTGWATTFDHHDPLDIDFFFPGASFTASDVYRVGAGQVPTWESRADANDPDAVLAMANYAGGSANGDTTVFSSGAPLTSDATTPLGGAHLFVRRGGHTTMVDGNGSGGALSDCGATLGSGQDSGMTPQNAVSADGSRIAFEVPDEFPGEFPGSDPSCYVPTRVYLRDHGVLREVSASQRTPNTPQTAPAQFQGAARDGSRILFASADQLTDDATTGGGLYAFDTASGDLSFLTTGATDPAGAGVLGLVKASADGATVFFLATGVLVPGQGTAGELNLYRADGSGVSFIATLDPNDATLTGSGGGGRGLLAIEAGRTARVTPDGRALIFFIAEGSRRCQRGWRAAALPLES